MNFERTELMRVVVLESQDDSLLIIGGGEELQKASECLLMCIGAEESFDEKIVEDPAMLSLGLIEPHGLEE